MCGEVWYAEVGFGEICRGEYWAIDVGFAWERLSVKGKCVGRFGALRSVLVKYAVGNIGQSMSILRGNVCPSRVSITII